MSLLDAILNQYMETKIDGLFWITKDFFSVKTNRKHFFGEPADHMRIDEVIPIDPDMPNSCVSYRDMTTMKIFAPTYVFMFLVQSDIIRKMFNQETFNRVMDIINKFPSDSYNMLAIEFFFLIIDYRLNIRINVDEMITCALNYFSKNIENGMRTFKYFGIFVAYVNYVSPEKVRKCMSIFPDNYVNGFIL